MVLKDRPFHSLARGSARPSPPGRHCRPLSAPWALKDGTSVNFSNLWESI